MGCKNIDKTEEKGCSNYCEVPQDYKSSSICAFEADCIEEECRVFCPSDKPCSESAICNCSFYTAEDSESCRCHEGYCVAVVDYECAEEGGYTSGPVRPEYQFSCCDGLQGFDTSQEMAVGGGLLCFDPDKGEPTCKGDGWYYPDGTLLKEGKCNTG